MSKRSREKRKGLSGGKRSLDHHQKEDQTHKVLQFPIKEKRESNQDRSYFAGIRMHGEGYISYETRLKKDYSDDLLFLLTMTDKGCNR